jgi:hypothetical protein
MHLLQLQLGINPHITGNKLLEYILKSQVTVSSKDYNGGMHLLQLQLGINPHITGNKLLEYILKSQVTVYSKDYNGGKHLLQLQLGINPHITGNKILENILKSTIITCTIRICSNSNLLLRTSLYLHVIYFKLPVTLGLTPLSVM